MIAAVARETLLEAPEEFFDTPLVARLLKLLENPLSLDVGILFQ